MIGSRLFVAALVTLSLVGWAAAGEENDTVVARARGLEVTRGEILDALQGMPAEQQTLVRNDPSVANTFLRSYTSMKVLAQEARMKGDYERTWMKTYVDSVWDKLISGEYVRKEVREKISVTDDDIALHYQMNPKDFAFAEQARGRHILIAVKPGAAPEERWAARDKAEEIRKRVLAGEDFASLAAELSDDRGSADRGGDLGWKTADQLIKPFAEALFRLEPGGVSDLVETRYGYHVIQLEEKKAGGTKPLGAVREEIRTKLRTQFEMAQVSEFIAAALENANTQVFPEKLGFGLSPGVSSGGGNTARQP